MKLIFRSTECKISSYSIAYRNEDLKQWFYMSKRSCRFFFICQGFKQGERVNILFSSYRGKSFCEMNERLKRTDLEYYSVTTE